LYSDVHNPVALILKFDKIQIENVNQPTVGIKCWDHNKADIFTANINTEKINSIYSALCDIEQRQTLLTSDLDDVVDEISKLLLDCAKQTLGTKIKFSHNIHTTIKHKAWFNTDCRVARKNFHSAKYSYKLRKSYQNKMNLQNKSKTYKHIMNKSFKEFKIKNSDKFKTLKTNKPRDFWKILSAK
jgi:hypothetical protein